MYKTILLAYDGSESGQNAVLECEELTQWSHSKLWIVAVRPEMTTAAALGGYAPTPESEAADQATYKELLKTGTARLAADGYTAESALLVGAAIDEIVKFANQVDADLIVVGHTHHATWLQRWWAHSIAGSLVEHAPCSVLCVVKKRSAKVA